MKTAEKKEFQLIDNTFTPDEADTMLNALINSKINYHNLDDFSNHVRTDRSMAHSKKRVAELNEMKKAVKIYIDAAKESGKTLTIKSTIAITTN